MRDPARLHVQHERLTVMRGDVTNRADVDKTVRGAEAVISVIGQSRTSPKNLQTVAMGHIIAAMRAAGVRRLVSLTGAGVPAPQDQPKPLNHLITFALKTLAGAVLRDGLNHAALIRASDLDWVIVRVPVLTEGPRVGTCRVGWVGVNTGARIARADVADFLLRELTDATYLRQAPMISA